MKNCRAASSVSAHAATLGASGKKGCRGEDADTFLWTCLRAFLDRHPLPRATIICSRKRTFA
jgi:hypothetical protein